MDAVVLVVLLLLAFVVVVLLLLLFAVNANEDVVRTSDLAGDLDPFSSDDTTVAEPWLG